MESLKLTMEEIGKCPKGFNPSDCFTEEELENLNDGSGVFTCPLGGCTKDIERKPGKVNTETITELDEEVAFNPSEFFENEKVEAAFNEVIEAKDSDDSDETITIPGEVASYINTLEEESEAAADLISVLENEIEIKDEIIEAAETIIEEDHPTPTAEEDELAISKIVATVKTYEPTKEEIEDRQATELANRFGFNFETDKPCMFDHRGIDFKVDKKLLTLAALKMFFAKNLYTKENLPSPQILGQAFRDWLVEVLKVYNKEADYEIKGFYELQPEAIAGLIANYENVAMFELLDNHDNVVSKQLCIYAFDKYGYVHPSVLRNNFERLIGMYEPKVKKHQVSKVISLLKKTAKTIATDDGYDKERHESFFKVFTYRALVKRLENPTQKEIAELDYWLD